MSSPNDPGQTGVIAGRVVGLLTALLVVGSLLSAPDESVSWVETVVHGVSVNLPGSATLYFYAYIVLAAIGQYVFSYVTGSLVGVLYSWLERKPIVIVTVVILFIGFINGFALRFDAQTTPIGIAYILAWCCFIPVFYYYIETTESQWGKTRRLDQRFKD